MKTKEKARLFWSYVTTDATMRELADKHKKSYQRIHQIIHQVHGELGIVVLPRGEMNSRLRERLRKQLDKYERQQA